MSSSYSQVGAFGAITRAALRSISKSPSAVVFTIAFPLIFILVFGFVGDLGGAGIKTALAPGTDTSVYFFRQLRDRPEVKIVRYEDSADLRHRLEKGGVDVLLSWEKTKSGVPEYAVSLRAARPSSVALSNRLRSEIMQIIAGQDPALHARMAELVHIRQSVLQQKEFKTIDFILPGQLGFSLLAASVFGTAFVFFNLRQGLVLKRFFATPVRRENIILAEGTARMVFQISGALLIILIGRFCLGYTLIHGWITVVNMLLVSAIGLLVFMSFGFIISGIARSESTIPPLANILTLPQFLLAGTFFPTDVFPGWLQVISGALPLTYLNDALRAIAFDGAGLWDVKLDIGILVLWGAIGYFAAGRVFKWE